MLRRKSIALFAIAGFVATPGLQAQVTYQLDNNTIQTALNVSDGTETRDNWFGNVFTVVSGATQITRVDNGLFTNAAGATASVVLYRVTDPAVTPPWAPPAFTRNLTRR